MNSLTDPFTDSSVVGMSGSANGVSSIAQLAALGPGIAWIDSSSYLFQFMVSVPLFITHTDTLVV